MQIKHFILDKILKLLTYHMPFYHQSLQSYLISKTVRFFWPTLYISIYNVCQKIDTRVILNILHSCKSIAMKFSILYSDDLSY